MINFLSSIKKMYTFFNSGIDGNSLHYKGIEVIVLSENNYELIYKGNHKILNFNDLINEISKLYLVHGKVLCHTDFFYNINKAGKFNLFTKGIIYEIFEIKNNMASISCNKFLEDGKSIGITKQNINLLGKYFFIK